MTATPRFPEPDRQALPADELAVLQAIEQRRGKLPAPFVPLLKSPEVADQFERLSTTLWSSLPMDVLELVFLMVAHRNHCAHQWKTHVPKALAAGVMQWEIDRIAANATLDEGLRGDVACFVGALLDGGLVPDALYERVRDQLRDGGVVNLVAFCGSASTVAWLLNLNDRGPATAGSP